MEETNYSPSKGSCQNRKYLVELQNAVAAVHEELGAEVLQVGADPEAVVPLAVEQEADLAVVAAVQEDLAVETGVDVEEVEEAGLVVAGLAEAAGVDVAGGHIDIDIDDPFQNGNVPRLVSAQ